MQAAYPSLFSTKSQSHIPQGPHPGHTGCIPKSTGGHCPKYTFPSLPPLSSANYNEPQVAGPEDAYPDLQDTLEGETEAGEPSSADRRSQSGLHICRGPRVGGAQAGDHVKSWCAQGRRQDLLGPQDPPGVQGCRRPPGAASGKVSVFLAPLPRLIPLRSEDSAPTWRGRGPRSITVPSSAKCGARAKRVRGRGRPERLRLHPSVPDRARVSPKSGAQRRGGPLAL